MDSKDLRPINEDIKFCKIEELSTRPPVKCEFDLGYVARDVLKQHESSFLVVLTGFFDEESDRYTKLIKISKQ